jgi:hypothetical protein
MVRMEPHAVVGNLIDQERYESWIRVSMSFSEEPWLLMSVQALGRLDAKLVAEDDRYVDLSDSQRIDLLEALRLMDRLTLSYLWVLGTYEMMRVFTTSRPYFEILSPVRTEMGQLFGRFERLRIPLAKMRPANKFPTDSPIAFAMLNEPQGISWRLSSDVYVTRRSLSDALLELLDRVSSDPSETASTV